MAWMSLTSRVGIAFVIVVGVVATSIALLPLLESTSGGAEMPLSIGLSHLEATIPRARFRAHRQDYQLDASSSNC